MATGSASRRSLVPKQSLTEGLSYQDWSTVIAIRVPRRSVDRWMRSRYESMGSSIVTAGYRHCGYLAQQGGYLHGSVTMPTCPVFGRQDSRSPLGAAFSRDGGDSWNQRRYLPLPPRRASTPTAGAS